MKQFNNYWIGCGEELGLNDYQAKEVWKAALRRVLDMQRENVNASDIHNKAYHIDDWSIYEIERELNDLTK